MADGPATAPAAAPALTGLGLIARRELTAHRRTFLVWVIPVTLLLVMVLSMQPSMAGQGGLLEAKLAAMPEGMRKAFGLAATLDFTRPPAFLSTSFIYVSLTSAIMAGMLGATLLAKEEAQHTAELLLTQPIGRDAIVAGKAVALAVYGLGFNLVLAVAAIVTATLVIDAPTEAGLIAQLFAGTAALAICFGGAGLCLATLFGRARTAPNAALALVLATYLVSAVSAVVPGLGFLGRVSPFHAVEAPRIIMEGGLDPIRWTAVVATGLILAAAAVLRYRRRDIHA